MLRIHDLFGSLIFQFFAASWMTVAGLALATSHSNAQSRGLNDLGARTGVERSGRSTVDVELVLAVDISWSMSDDEQILQRNGYAAAFRSSDVQDAILDGVHGSIAVTYVEWAGEAYQSIVVPWTLIDSKASADAFAYQLATRPPTRARRTSISSGIRFSAGLFEANGFEGLKQVVDVSGDGPNNQGPRVTEERDAAIAQGIVINGLPLMTGDHAASWATIDDLDLYYEACVVGGPGAFVIPVRDWSQFPRAVRRKLVLELAQKLPTDMRNPQGSGAQRPVVLAQSRSSVDCLVGERLWQERQRRWLDDVR